MNSKFVDFKRTVSINWNKSNEQPNNNEILEKKKNSYVQLHINKQEHDDIDNFHDEALKVADMLINNYNAICQSTKFF